MITDQKNVISQQSIHLQKRNHDTKHNHATNLDCSPPETPQMHQHQQIDLIKQYTQQNEPNTLYANKQYIPKLAQPKTTIKQSGKRQITPMKSHDEFTPPMQNA